MKVTISKGNSKVGHIANVSLTPIKACKGCDKVCGKDCYGMKSYRQYPNVRKAWDGNLEIATNDMPEYFAKISAFLAKYKGKFFRWHVAGDILNDTYLVEMTAIANMFPEINFLAFTKQYAIINDHIAELVEIDTDYVLPENLTVIFSSWPGLPMDNPYNFPIAWMDDGTDPRIPADAIHCPGNCETCGMCWSLGTIGRDVVFGKH